MEEIRIDCLNQTEQELAAAKELRQDIFLLNHTMPDTDEYQDLLHKVFPHLGENCRVEIPFSGVRTANVSHCHARLPDDVSRRNHDRR